MATIEDYLNSIGSSKSSIKQALIDMHVNDPTNNFLDYPDKMEDCDSTPRISVATSAGSTCTGVPIVQKDMWEKSTINNTNRYISCCYGRGRFVAIPSTGTSAIYSLDGITWNNATLANSISWNKIVYVKNRFIAVGANTNKLNYSADGIQWTSVTLPITDDWIHVCEYGNSYYLIVSSPSSYLKIYSSTDCTTWTLDSFHPPLTYVDLCSVPTTSDTIAITPSGQVNNVTNPSVISDPIDSTLVWKGIRASENGNYYAFTNTLLKCSTDGGSTWNDIFIGTIKNVLLIGDSILLIGDDIRYSIDSGDTWNTMKGYNISDYSTICLGWDMILIFNKLAATNEIYYTDAHLGSVVRSSSGSLEAGDGCTNIIGYVRGHTSVPITLSGTYASSSYIYMDNRAFLDPNTDALYIIMKGGISTSYENIYYIVSSVPTGVTLEYQSIYNVSSTPVGEYYVAKFIGITGPILLSIALSGNSTAYDYYAASVSIEYV